MSQSHETAQDCTPTPLMNDPDHQSWLIAQAKAQFDFFRDSLRPDGGFYVLETDGSPLDNTVQELHTTTRLIHSYALGETAGFEKCDEIIDHGMRYLWNAHRDIDCGGYFWAIDGAVPHDTVKLAYGHVFVLLAGASAKTAGHPDADRLIQDATDVIDRHFWQDDVGLLSDEYSRDWTPFSTYRGFNANMHGTEAMLAAFEATGTETYLHRAGRMLDFFVNRIASARGWRVSEHYDDTWTPDPDYAGNPMFRPWGTTPGHSFELGRLMIQFWDLSGRPDDDSLANARRLIETALDDAWLDAGGFAYTLDYTGNAHISDRYWWPVTEAIGACAALIKADGRPEDELWYRKLWHCASNMFIDHEHNGWFPEIDADNRPVANQFIGKPDIYHSIQATLFPLVPNLSMNLSGLKENWPPMP